MHNTAQTTVEPAPLLSMMLTNGADFNKFGFNMFSLLCDMGMVTQSS